uniref:(northern house mosquito) hypothetical protein n=1 Tax=Culex pipiens TaxID=7175 RepID=A0A8D8ACW5_CULPI
MGKPRNPVLPGVRLQQGREPVPAGLSFARHRRPAAALRSGYPVRAGRRLLFSHHHGRRPLGSDAQGQAGGGARLVRGHAAPVHVGRGQSLYDRGPGAGRDRVPDRGVRV